MKPSISDNTYYYVYVCIMYLEYVCMLKIASRRELMTTLLENNERLGTDYKISNLIRRTLFYSTLAATLIVAITFYNPVPV